MRSATLSDGAHAADLLFSSHQSPLRTTLERRYHQFALQAVGHGVSERVLCRRPHRPSDASDAPRRNHFDRGGELSQARGRTRTEEAAGRPVSGAAEPSVDRVSRFLRFFNLGDAW